MYPFSFKNIVWFSVVESSKNMSASYVSNIMDLLGLKQIAGAIVRVWNMAVASWQPLCLFFVLGLAFLSPASWLAIPKQRSYREPGCYPHYPFHLLTYEPLVMPGLDLSASIQLICPTAINILHSALASDWLSLLTFYWLHLSAKFAALCLFFILKV